MHYAQGGQAACRTTITQMHCTLSTSAPHNTCTCIQQLMHACAMHHAQSRTTRTPRSRPRNGRARRCRASRAAKRPAGCGAPARVSCGARAGHLGRRRRRCACLYSAAHLQSAASSQAGHGRGGECTGQAAAAARRPAGLPAVHNRKARAGASAAAAPLSRPDDAVRRQPSDFRALLLVPMAMAMASTTLTPQHSTHIFPCEHAERAHEHIGSNWRQSLVCRHTNTVPPPWRAPQAMA